MRARKTPSSNHVYRLPGGNEDNDLHCQIGELEGRAVIVSVWEPSPQERAAIAAGANLELILWGTSCPPLALNATREQPVSNPQRATTESTAPIWLELDRPVAQALVNVVDHVDDVLPDDPAARRELELVRELRDNLECFLAAQDAVKAQERQG